MYIYIHIYIYIYIYHSSFTRHFLKLPDGAYTPGTYRLASLKILRPEASRFSRARPNTQITKMQAKSIIRFLRRKQNLQ